MKITTFCGLLSVRLFLAASATLCAAPAPAAYYELRIYTVTSNKMDGVLGRFRDTVEPVRRKHGIKTAGYWSAPRTANGGTFAYLMVAASTEAVILNCSSSGAGPAGRSLRITRSSTPTATSCQARPNACSKPATAVYCCADSTRRRRTCSAIPSAVASSGNTARA